MPATDCQGSSTPSRSFGRSILSLQRDHVPSMDGPYGGQEIELEAFQKEVAEQLRDLSSASPDELLSLSWVRRLLDVFVFCLEEFRIVLFNNKGCLNRPPMDRLIAEFHERSVKALDVCNAIRDGIEQVRQWERLLEIVLCALDNRKALSEGQIRRAKKALADLMIGMLDEKESNAALTHRNRSFGRNKDHHHKHNSGHFRSLSWSVSRSWSASKQLQAMGCNLSAPKANDVMATKGIAVALYTMSCVLVLVMWTLVAAIPCQDRGLQTHFSISKHFIWANPISSLHERIVEESKKRERKNACGLLKEIYQTEKWTRQMNEMLDSLQFPLSYEKEAEVRDRVEELKVVFESLRGGLPPLEEQVREVFQWIVRCRAQGLDSLGKGSNGE